MTYADNYNIRTTSVKFNDVADALDGLITRNYAGLTTGTSTAYIASPSPSWDAYTTSGLVVIIPHITNTGAATINISGLGARDLKIGNAAIAAGVLQQNIPTIMAYTGTYFEILLQNISIPTGQITAFAGTSAPAGWLACDGVDYNTYTYRTLHAVISNTYGGTAYNPGTTDQPSASTTFKVPDLRRRFAVGKGASDTLGNTEGGDNTGTAYASRSMSHNHTISHTHTVPSHTHDIGSHTHTVNSHSHTAGGLRAQIGVDLGSASSGISLGMDGTNQWYSTYRWTASGVSTNSPNSNQNSTVIFGSTDNSSPGTSGPQTSGVTGGATATITTSSISDSNSGSTTTPFLFVNYIIKT